MTRPSAPTRTSMHSPPEEPTGGEPAKAIEDQPAAEPTATPTTEPQHEAAPAAQTNAADPSGASTSGGTKQPGSTGAPADRPNYKAVARISTQAALEGIQLASTRADLLRGTQVPADWASAATTTSNALAEFDREGLRLVVYCGFVATWPAELEADRAEDSGRKPPFELHAQFRLEYVLKDLAGIEEGDEEHFARTNGMLHAWPYWREIAQSTTLRMGMPPLLAGTFKIPWSGDPGRKAKNLEESKADAVTEGEVPAEATSAETGEREAPQAAGSE